MAGYGQTPAGKQVGLVSNADYAGNSDIDQMKQMASKMGLMPDIHDMLEAFEECKLVLTTKALELNALQALAMESDDENITELREQLFVVTKLLYSDIIEDIIKESVDSEAKKERVTGFVGGFQDGNVKADLSRGNIFQKMRIYMNKRSKYKKDLKKIKKRLKENMDL